MIARAVGTPIPAVEQGLIIASILRGAWRGEPGSTSISEAELALVVPILVRSGAAAIAWRRIRQTPLAGTEAGREVLTARRIQAAHAAIREAQLAQVLALDAVRDADPILLKGWAHGQLYPEPAVRHYTDIDLLIQPQYAAAVGQAVATFLPVDPARAVPVDVQTKLKDLPERSWADLNAHARVLPLSSGQVRVLGAEDTLRLSCIHMLRHLGFHPLWLCDVSVLVENLPADFDWDYCLAGERRRTEWMLAVLRVANQVVGTRLDRCPQRRVPQTVPPWMVRAMLRWWGTETTYAYPWPLPNPVVSVAKDDPRRVLQVFSERWPDPLEAVSRFAWPINRFTGLTAQLLDFTGRALIWAPRQLGLFPRKISH
jgi:hypothetical protein